MIFFSTIAFSVTINVRIISLTLLLQMIPCVFLLRKWSHSAVNRYECFMENKNIIRTFCGCKPSKNIKPHQNFIGSSKQSIETLGELQDIQNIKRKKGK